MDTATLRARLTGRHPRALDPEAGPTPPKLERVSVSRDDPDVPEGVVAAPLDTPEGRALTIDRPIPAAVLVAVVTGPDPGVLLTQRTAHLAHHAGQVSFPGGRIEPDDPDPERAALREAAEEVGLQSGQVELLGRLADHVTGTGFVITPITALVPPSPILRAAPDEVAAIFRLPLSVVLDPAAPQRRRAERRGRWREFWVWPHEQHYIWGATAAILVQLARVLGAPPPHALTRFEDG